MLKIQTKWHKSISEISKEDWERLAGINQIPFFQWDWLKALENSNSVINKNGWQPIFLSAWRANSIIGLAPLYLKSHSYGEFIFDNIFAQIAFDLGLNYYPKIVGMSPLSPVQGFKFFCSEEEDEEQLTKLLINKIDTFAINNNILSANFLYIDSSWKQSAKKANCLEWINEKSLLSLQGYDDFNSYLQRFNANQRRNIKRERNAIKKEEIEISTISGNAITSIEMDLMYYFYKKHCAKWGVWGSKYLTPEFFKELSKECNKKNLVLFSAKRKTSSKTLAMSLCVKNKDMLWGRYWGSDEEIDCLHFELCYYSPIEWAIQNKIKSFDPGAGGSQKRRRGFELHPNASMHRWYNQDLEKILKKWLPKANDLMLEHIKTTNSEVPFRN